MPRIAELPSAIESFADVESRLEGRRPAVFLDYDGTLTPIVDRPEDAVLSDAMRDRVRRLARRCPVAIVSGRDRADVARLVALDELVVAGSHGFDIRGPGGLELQHDEAARLLPTIARAGEELERRLATVAGALVERKKYSIAVHYRLVDEERVDEVRRAVEEVVAQYDELRETHGKMVLDVQPRLEWHKGKAVDWLLRALGLDGEGVLPIYVGDDLTDEDAFAALRARDRGVGVIVVGDSPNRDTAAHFSVPDVDDAGKLLERLAGDAAGEGR